MFKRRLKRIAAMTSAVLFINAGICTFTASADSSESYIITSDEGAGVFVNVEDTPNTTVDELLSNGEYTLIFPSDLDKLFENVNIITPPSPSSDITVLRPNPDGYAISFNKAPTKSVYHIGEELDITGAQIYYCYDNNELADSIFYASLDSCLENGMMTIDDSEFDNTKAGTYAIYVHYGTATASFDVTVIDDETDLPDELTLHCYPYRLDFDLNMELDLSGAIISGSYGEKGENYEFRGEYLTDMIEKGIVEVDVSEYNSSEIGTYTIYVKLGTAVESFDVRVGCPLVQNILEIKSLPDKTVYTYGEELDFTGAVLYGWARGDGGFIPDTEFTEDLQTLIDSEKIKVDDSGFYDTKSGICTIYINYEHAWATFEVTVTDEAAEQKTIANGDANGDGNFTIADMVMVQKHIMGKKTTILSDWKCADFYEDGKIDVYDFIVMRENFVKNMK